MQSTIDFLSNKDNIIANADEFSRIRIKAMSAMVSVNCRVWHKTKHQIVIVSERGNGVE